MHFQQGSSDTLAHTMEVDHWSGVLYWITRVSCPQIHNLLVSGRSTMANSINFSTVKTWQEQLDFPIYLTNYD